MELQSFKCKNCGGIMQAVANEEGVLKCEYCESIFTIPKIDSDAEVLQYLNIGEHGLDTCHFDDAFTAYQKAALLNKKEPEAYWGMALATAGVQYLDDCEQKHLQPIVHNITGKDFSKDKNYLKAISLATYEQKAEYIQKANEINDIHKKFYDLKQSGLYYDCFICVKVTEDGSERHTEDSVIANKIYDLLKEEGFNPFYSEEEIQGRTGSDYEAMILYALHSSPCMFVVCTNEDYLQTPWVKNEYTRFLKMLRDEEKERESLTFVFQNNVVEKLPGVAGKIQGINFKTFNASEKIKDFVEKFAVKNIPEIARKEYSSDVYVKKQTMKQSVVKRQLTAATIGEITVSDQSKLKMANQFLERDNFASAASLCKNMIRENPSNSEAYWMLFLAENNCSNEKEFKNLQAEVDDFDNLEKAIASVSDYARKRVFYSALYYYAKKTLHLNAYVEFITLPDSKDRNIEELSKVFYQKALTEKNEDIFNQVIKTITNTDQYIDMNFEFANILPADSAQKYYDNILKVDEGHHKALWHSFVNGIPDLFAYFSDENNFKLIEDKIYSYGFNEYATDRLIEMVQSNLEENIDNACKIFDFIISMIPKENNDLYLEYLNDMVDKLIKLGRFGKVTKYNEMLLVMDQYDHNAHFNRCLITHNISNPIGLVKYADRFMDDKNFYAAMSSYSEKYPDNDNIYMEIASQLEKLFCVNDYPDILDNIVSRVYVSRDELVNCYDTIINVIQAVGNKLYNGILQEHNCKTDRDFYQLTEDVTKNKHWQMIRDIAVICNDKDKIQIVDELRESQPYISRKNRVEIKSLRTLRTLAFTNIIVIFAIIAFFVSFTLRSSIQKLDYFCYLIFGTTNFHAAFIVVFIFAIVGIVICLFKLLVIQRTPKKTEIIKLRMGKYYSIISNVIASAVLIALFSILIVPSVKISQANTGKNGLYTFNDNMFDLKEVAGGYSIERVLVEQTEITIPSKINYKQIVEIGDEAFYNNYRLKSVYLPNSIKHIGNSAFYGCSQIESIVLPDSVLSIGDRAFKDCRNLKNLVMGANANNVGTDAFKNCEIEDAIVPSTAVRFLDEEKLISLEILGSTISGIDFDEFENLEKLVLNEGIRSIPYQAFAQCRNLKEVVIPNSVTTVTTNAFGNCRIEKATMPNIWLKYFPKTYLREIVITNGDSLDDSAFSNNAFNLERVVLPNGMTGIGNYAFSRCQKLKNVTLPSTLTTIGDYAFYGCTSLKQLDIPQSVKYIGDNAFEDSGIEEIELPDNVTSLGDNVFSSCDNLKSVVLGKGIKNIGQRTFYNCSNLESISMSDEVTEIGDYAFYYCIKLKNINLPTNLTAIGNYAFSNCESLAGIAIPNNLQMINQNVFSDCYQLKSVKFGTSLKTIGYNAFEGCRSLTELNFEYVESIGNTSFFDCDGLLKVTLSSNVKTIGYNAFFGCDGAIFYCESTSKPDNWNNSWMAGDYAVIWDYKNNTTPGYLHLNGVKYTLNHNDKTAVIEKQSYSLNGDVEIPANVECNNVAFSVKTIKDSAFDACKIKNIKIADGVEIEARAFFNCFELESIQLPVTLTKLPYWMIYSCRNLSKIYFDGTSSQWLNLQKNENWAAMTSNFTIECSDGKILSKDDAILN